MPKGNLLRLLLIFTSGMAICGFGFWLVTFILLYLGYSIYEPNKLIALAEATLAGVLAFISLITFILLVRQK